MIHIHILKTIVHIFWNVSILYLGRIAGWGLTMSGGLPSEILKIVELPVIDRAQCISESDVGFRPNITPDKFCAGYLNSNVSVCQGQYINNMLLLLFESF